MPILDYKTFYIHDVFIIIIIIIIKYWLQIQAYLLSDLGDGRIKCDHTELETLWVMQPIWRRPSRWVFLRLTTGVALKDDIVEELINVVETGE